MPRPNNLNRLYRMFYEAHSQMQRVSLNQIMSEFNWTESTARANISNLRREYGVTIRNARWDNSYRMIRPSLQRDINGNVIQPNTVNVGQEPGQVTTEDTLYSLIFDLSRISRNTDWSSWINQHIEGDRPIGIIMTNPIYNNIGPRVRNYITTQRRLRINNVVNTTPDTLWTGIPVEISNFYMERAMEFGH